MSRINLSVVAALTCLCVGSLGCEWVGDIGTIRLVAADGGLDAQLDAPPGDVLDGDIPDTSPPHCEWATGAYQVRVANLDPEAHALDVCVTSTGVLADGQEPLFRAAGEGCPVGLSFPSMTSPIGVDASHVDIRLVPAGSEDCKGESVAELKGVALDAQQPTTVMYFGDSGGGPTLTSMVDSAPGFQSTKIRFVHALHGEKKLSLVIPDKARLPAEVRTIVAAAVDFGGGLEAGDTPAGKVDDHGYLTMSTGGGSIRFGYARPGAKDAMSALSRRYEASKAYTLFAVGQEGDYTSPPSLWVCDEGATEHQLFTWCGTPVDLKVGVFSPQVTDLFTAFIDQRRQPVIQALAKSDADLMCVNEIYDPQDQDALLKAATKSFPYSVASKNMVARAEMLADKNGNLAPRPQGSACRSTEVRARLDSLLACIEKHCMAPQQGQPHFKMSGDAAANCVSDSCFDEAADLLLQEGAENQRCWMCALANMAARETPEEVRQACGQSKDRHDRLAFHGSLGLVVLSRFPITGPETYELPSTGWNRGVIRAPVMLPNGAAMDFYCAHLSLPNANGALFPYVGPYGSSMTEKGWEEEQLLQAQRVVRLVKKHAAENNNAHSVLTGTFYAGRAYGDTIAADHQAVYDAIADQLMLGVADNYVPRCTYCPDNPIQAPPGTKPQGQGTWTTHIFVDRIQQQSISNTKRLFTEPAVEVTSEGKTYQIPLSSHYGLQSNIRVVP